MKPTTKPTTTPTEPALPLVNGCCCGIDVHKDTVVACVRTTGPDGRAVNDVRTFGTTTKALLELADWLAERCVTSVAMESTGVYWKPVWNLLEGRATADGEPISTDAGQRPAHAERAGAQDRREGLPVDRAAAGGGAAVAQLRARAAPARAPRPDPPAGAVGRRQGVASPTASRRCWRTPT